MGSGVSLAMKCLFFRHSVYYSVRLLKLFYNRNGFYLIKSRYKDETSDGDDDNVGLISRNHFRKAW